MENKHTIGDLRQMQSLPLSAKIRMTEYRIRQWYEEFEGQVYVSFSGGKDSTVLLDIARKLYPDIHAIWVNTGLEYPSVRQFALSKENVTELRPTMNFRDVIIKYGYPIIGKQFCKKLSETRRGSEIALRNFSGEMNGGLYDYSRYSFILNAPFSVSEKCCDVMKKKPFKSVHGFPIIGSMAEESTNRLKSWYQNGCNAFYSKNPKSNPMSFWTEQDVLQYIRENNLAIAGVYGQVVVKNEGVDGQMNIHDYIGDYRGCQYETTGCKRTGCIFCGFGITQDKQRFARLSDQEPKLCDYVMRGGEFWHKVFDKNGFEIKLKHCTHNQISKWCVDNSANENFKIESMWQPSKDGLGYWFVLEWLNVHGNLKIGIPNRNYYMDKYCAEENRKYLELEVN